MFYISKSKTYLAYGVATIVCRYEALSCKGIPQWMHTLQHTHTTRWIHTATHCNKILQQVVKGYHNECLSILYNECLGILTTTECLISMRYHNCLGILGILYNWMPHRYEAFSCKGYPVILVPQLSGNFGTTNFGTTIVISSYLDMRQLSGYPLQLNALYYDCL